MDISEFFRWKMTLQMKKGSKEWYGSWTGNNIGAEGAAKISESLMTNTTLATLNLGGDDNIIKNKR